MSIAIFLAGLLPLAGGQQGTSPEIHQKKAHEMKTRDAYASLEQMLDGDVQLAPSAEERAEEGQDAEHGSAAIEDLVLDTHGKIHWAILSVGGVLGMGDRQVLVPIDRIRHETNEDGEKVCHLGMSEKELERLPEFDYKTAQKNGRLDAMVQAVATAFPDRKQGGERTVNRSGETDRGDGYDGRPVEAGAPKEKQARKILASALLDADLEASDEEFGEVSDAVVDTSSGEVCYVIVKHGGTLGMGGDKFLLPLKALDARTDADDEGELKLHCKMTVAQLEQSTRYEKPDEGFVTKQNLEHADRAHNVTRDSKGSTEKDMERKSGKGEEYKR